MSMSKGQQMSHPRRVSRVTGSHLRSPIEPLAGPSNRREFLRQSAYFAGLVALAPAVLATLTACHDTPMAPGVAATIDFSTETGAINFCYAMAQLEADMYYRIRTYQYGGMLLSEKNTFTANYNTTYAMTRAIKQLSIHRITDSILFNYDTVNFTDRDSTLAAAQIVAEATANGYVAAEVYVTSSDNSTLISTWATDAVNRATGIRAMLGLGAFTPSTATPSDVLAILDPYYTTRITLVNMGAAA
jgi:hypothetical protein